MTCSGTDARGRHRALGLGEMQDDKESDEYKQDELIDKMV